MMDSDLMVTPGVVTERQGVDAGSISLETRRGFEHVRRLAAKQGFISSDCSVQLTLTERSISLSFSAKTMVVGCSLAGHTLDAKQDVFVDFSQSKADKWPAEYCVAVISVGQLDRSTTERVDRVIDGQGHVLAKVCGCELTDSSNNEYFGYVLGLISCNFAVDDAVLIARSLMDVSRETWPERFCDFSPILQPDAYDSNGNFTSPECSMRPFEPMTSPEMGLYPVVDSVAWVELLLNAGVKTLQLRIKDPCAHNLEQDIQKAVCLAKQSGAQLFINDHWELAVKYGAYGVHLGQEDVVTANLEAIQQSGLRLGLSTHGYYEILRVAQLAPSYIALGHIFPTTTKTMPSLPQGLHRLKQYQELVKSLASIDKKGLPYPTVAIGGINLENANEVLQCGVSTVAVVRAVTESENVNRTLQDFKQIIDRPYGEKHAYG
jgi:thiamine-phosphate diphosphorylase